MPKRTIFTDENDNEMELFVNQNGELYVAVGKLKEDYYNGFITLNQEDVEELIKMLEELKNEMFE
ncbi:hypothetical protein CHRYSEOSP005_17800 [Chryseobacterium sp. Alg-005]|uniref:hypothetical protein n=1 Tax=Chryseobacterium sp. Alg-005 TaxID=3159516 RepID=UPI0035559C50